MTELKLFAIFDTFLQGWDGKLWKIISITVFWATATTSPTSCGTSGEAPPRTGRRFQSLDVRSGTAPPDSRVSWTPQAWDIS